MSSKHCQRCNKAKFNCKKKKTVQVIHLDTSYLPTGSAVKKKKKTY